MCRLAGRQPVYRQRVPEEHGIGNAEGVSTMSLNFNFARVQGYLMAVVFVIVTFILPPDPPITRTEQLLLVVGIAICLSIGHLPQEKTEDGK